VSSEIAVAAAAVVTEVTVAAVVMEVACVMLNMCKRWDGTGPLSRSVSDIKGIRRRNMYCTFCF
jgi:hypothetical protein